MPRITLFCIVEGQTENAVMKRLIATHLSQRGVDFHAPIVRVGAGRGGVKFLEAHDLFRQIRNFLKDSRQPYVTTFFDYYAFPTGESKGWGVAAKAKAEASFRGAHNAAALIEEEIKTRALEGVDTPDKVNRLIPYIQLSRNGGAIFCRATENG